MNLGMWALSPEQSTLDSQLASSAKTLALSSKSHATVTKYFHGFMAFYRWLRERRSATFPCNGFVMGLYLTKLHDEGKGYPTILAAFYSIKWAHEICGFQNPAQHPLPGMILNASKRLKPPQNNQKKPITPDVLTRLVKQHGQDNNSIRELRFVTLAVLSYSGFLRFSEASHVKREDVTLLNTYLKIYIPKSKTDVHSEGTTIHIAATGSITCPLKIVKNYLLKTGIDCPNSYIFRKTTTNGRKQTLSKTNRPISYSIARKDLAAFLSNVVDDAHNYGLHSFRSGGATAAANNEVCDRLFKRHGRWKSDSAKDLYVHENLKQKLLVSKNIGL